MLKDYFLMLRPKQYLKNLFVVAPLFFSLKFFDYASCLQVFWIFLAFCSAASLVYIFNDILDADNDRKHPLKCLRPIASGRVGKVGYFSVLLGLLGIMMLAFFIINNSAANLVVIVYILVNFIYSVKLKQIAIIDVFTIALGFVLRVFAGALSIGVPVSEHIVLTTLSLAMFLGFSKRKSEIQNFGNEARDVLKDYSLAALNVYVTISATLCIMSYFLYTLENNNIFNNCLIFSSVFVIYGIFRYILIIDKKTIDDPTEMLFDDKQLHVVCVLYVLYILSLFCISHFSVDI